MPFLGRKRKRDEDDILETATVDVRNVVRTWRDESGLGVSVDVSRTVGEDFANISLLGLDSVSASDLEAFETVPNVTDFVCDFQNQALVVRVERRIGARESAPAVKKISLSALDTAVKAEKAALHEQLVAKNWENEDLERFARHYDAFRSKIRGAMLEKEGPSVKVRDAPGACTFFVKGFKFLDRTSLKEFSDWPSDFFGVRVDFRTRTVKINYHKGKTLL